ncbi:hypothetical protein FSP39_004120 [Pinctada imbricata]|nr:hypothetical protein FSP39_004120 [Pinctada imbricata]
MSCQGGSGGTVCAVKVDIDQDTILDWYALKVNEVQTFSSLFECICEASERGVPGARFKRKIDIKDSSYSSCFIKSSEGASEIEVGWTLLVYETLTKFNCSKVYFKVKNTVEKVRTNVDAFSQLIEGQRKLQQNALRYPSKFGQDPVTRGDWRLKNDFIEKILQTKSIGFHNGEEKTIGRTVVNAICDCLYYIFPHLATLKERFISLPPLFDVLYNKHDLTQDYNDPSKYKHKAKPMERSNLVELTQNLFQILTFPYMSLPRVSDLKQSVLQLASDISKYQEYLGAQNKRMLTLHNLPNPVRQPNDGISTCLRHVPGSFRGFSICEKYMKLEQALNDVHTYSPICINDFAPSDRQRRYHYIQDIQFPFDVTVYAYSSGGPHESLHFIWKCSKMLDLQQANKVIHEIERNIPIYHTRAMRRDFRDRFSLVCKATPSVMNEMYRHLTGDSSVPGTGIEKAVRERLLVLLDSQNSDLVYDMRTLHHDGEKEKCFEKFFEEVEKYINEYELKAVDDRRHGLVSHLSVAISVRDLREQISARLPNETPIPSEEWLRLQFMPKNEVFHSAVNYTGRFPLKYKIQSRQFNAFHIDAHYVSAIQMYLKDFVVQNRENCVLLSVDDKNHIPVGEPGIPIASIYRSKKAVTHSNVLNIAADHDTASKCKLTPSVTLVIDIPEESSGDFYSGQVSVSL